MPQPVMDADAPARAGDREAQYQLGYFLSDEEDNQDLELAVFWLGRAARQGHAEAMFCLGRMVEGDEGPVRDPEQAEHWYRLAAAAGHERARAELADQPPAEGDDKLSRAIGGDARSQYDLGFAHFMGTGASKNYEQSYFWFQVLSKTMPAQAAQMLQLLDARLDDQHRAQLDRAVDQWRPGVHPPGADVPPAMREAATLDDPEACYQLAKALKALGSTDARAESLEWLVWAARNDHAAANYDLARHYCDVGDSAGTEIHLYHTTRLGYAIPADDLFLWKTEGYIPYESDEEAIALLAEGAKRGMNQCRYELANRMVAGRGTAANPHLSASLYSVAATQGHVPSMAELGACYLNGYAVAQDLEMADHWFGEAARHENPKGWFGQGIIRRNRGLAAAQAGAHAEAGRHYQEAARFFELGAAKGHPDSLYVLGIAHSAGQGVPRSARTMHELIARAARKGHLESLYLMGSWYAEGDEEIEQDDQKAVSYYQRAADAGHSGAILRLAAHTLFGRGVEQNSEKGIALTEKAAQMGEVTAMLAMGRMIGMGEVPMRDPRTALYWYQKAAELGSPEGNYKAAKILLDRSEGAAALPYLEKAAGQDYEDARTLLENWIEETRSPYAIYGALEKVADSGDVEAMLKLARMVESGEAPMSDPQTSLYWYQKAADRGHTEASYIVGRRLLDVPNGEGQARIYLEQAVAGGHTEAKSLLNSPSREAPARAMPDGQWSDDPLTKALAGDVNAQMQLGFAHYSGVGAAQSFPLCYFWLKVVAKTMPMMGGQMLDMIGGQLGAAKRQELDQLVEAWTPGTPPPTME